MPTRKRVRSNVPVWLTVVLCLFHAVQAQSGRRTLPSVPAPPAAESNATPSLPKPATRAAAVIVSGEIVHDNVYFSSNVLDLTIKECMNALKGSGVPDVTNGGKMKFNEAKDRAKSEAEKYVVWISFVTHTNGLGSMVVDYADYAVLTPKTSFRITSGRVTPGESSVVGRGGVLNIPAGRTNRSSLLLSMRSVAREVAGVLVHGGWLAH